MDGIDLRDKYADWSGDYPEKGGPCSVLEMMVGLSIRCENELMHDSLKGDRTSVWFWIMIDNLGLDQMDDYEFDEDYCNYILERFLNREYDSDGFGGPFFIHDFDGDMTNMELWYQLNFYIDSRYPV